MKLVLERLRLTNFRGFEDHDVPLLKLTVIVGANNAGKSTLVEALRLIALVVGRLRRGVTKFVGIPDWLEHPQAFRGIAPALRGRGFEGHGPSTFHRYRDPPAAITADFGSGASVTVFLGPEGEAHGVARDASGKALGGPADVKRLELTPIAIQPQVAPLLRGETLLTEQTIRRGDGTYLAPQHFRNQLHYFHQHFDEFRALAERTWPRLQITELEVDELYPDRPLQLRLRVDDFVGEASLMGHGLQMWLQTIWFLARTEPDATVVLDEPDVYMHPDLQRQLLTVVRERFDQLLIATHSIEIVSDVDPRSLLAVDRRQAESSFVTSLPGAPGGNRRARRRPQHPGHAPVPFARLSSR
jgi:energy-coupling factor transporter ATP-binding protein EcfA2